MIPRPNQTRPDQTRLDQRKRHKTNGSGNVYIFTKPYNSRIRTHTSTSILYIFLPHHIVYHTRPIPDQTGRCFSAPFRTERHFLSPTRLHGLQFLPRPALMPPLLALCRTPLCRHEIRVYPSANFKLPHTNPHKAPRNAANQNGVRRS